MFLKLPDEANFVGIGFELSLLFGLFENWQLWSFKSLGRLNFKSQEVVYNYSMVPNNSAARLLIFKIFSLPTRLIWTYTLIKIQIIFLPTRLLSIDFAFLSTFNALCSRFLLQMLQKCMFFMYFLPFISF